MSRKNNQKVLERFRQIQRENIDRRERERLKNSKEYQPEHPDNR